MRVFLLLLFFNLTHLAFSNNVTLVYLFPGQGSDDRLFEKIKLDSNFRIVNVTYPTPAKGTTMREFAHIISKQIDTSQKYIFIGVSLGGMICSELADFMKPEKIIIISSARCCKELPFRYKFQKIIPLNKIIPKGLIKIGAQLLQPIVEPDRKKNAATFKSMLKSKNPTYYKRTVDMIINWDKKTYNNDIIQIHGTNDHTIPIRNLNANYKIDKGSHMMTLTRGDELNKLILSILTAKE
jgi:pimeloyl-ACP methyl ester carboxylesterase